MMGQPGARKLLGPSDEPQSPGALVAVHYGDYRRQEVWVNSGANVGNWYPLGGEFWVVWDRKRMPVGVTRSDPTWADVLARGPVTLLVAAEGHAYREGWRNGRRDLCRAIEDLAEEEAPALCASGCGSPVAWEGACCDCDSDDADEADRDRARNRP